MRRPTSRAPLLREEFAGAIVRWTELFNAGEYFAAHEALEEPWLRAVEPEKTHLKGLIHVAVALHQFRRGNSHGARVKYLSAVRYLGQGQAPPGTVHIPELLRQMAGFFAPLLEQPPGERQAGEPPPAPAAPWPVALPGE